MRRKNEQKPKATAKGKKNEKDNKAKKPVTGKTATGRNKSLGAGKTATGKQSSSGQATPPAKRTKKDDSGKKKSLIQKLISLLKKRAKQKKQVKPKDEFRFNHDTGHMNFVFGETEEEYKSVGLTSKETTFGKKNMPLEQNPKKGDSGKSYIRNGIISDNKRSYSEKTAKNYEFSKADKSNVKSKVRNYKKEQKRKKAPKGKKN